MSRAEILSALSLLAPYDIDLPKRRAGPERDGAYVVVDCPSTLDVMSFGIGCNIGFEHELAERGHRVFLYDHTIRRLPASHPRFHLVRAGICSPGEQARRLRTLDEHLAAITDPTAGMILKIDVEGAEWGAFAAVDPALLARFEMILVEFHDLARLAEPGFRATAWRALSAINERFTLFHVHGNNIAGMGLAGDFPVANVLEVSYVRSDLVSRRPSRTLYPSPLNRSNAPERPDLPLLFYPFLPADADPIELAALAARIDADHVGGVSAA